MPYRVLVVGGPRMAFIQDWTRCVSSFAEVSYLTDESQLDESPPAGPYEGGWCSPDGLPGYGISTPPKRPGRYWLSLYRKYRLGSKIIERHGRPDILHSHFYAEGVAAALLSRKYGIPLVHTEHSSALSGLNPDNRLSLPGRRLLRFVFRNAAVALTVSESMVHWLQKQGVHQGAQVVRNPVDTSLFRPPEGPARTREVVRIAAVSGLVGVKRVPLLLEAIASVCKCRRVHLDIVGDGPLRQDCEALVGRLGIAGCVTFHGWRPREAVADVLRSADLFVHASDVETGNAALAEALCSGLPAVVTRVGANRELVTPPMGVLVPPGDAGALASGILEVLDMLQSYDRFQIAAQNQSIFSYAVVAEQIRACYEQAVLSRNYH